MIRDVIGGLCDVHMGHTHYMKNADFHDSVQVVQQEVDTVYCNFNGSTLLWRIRTLFREEEYGIILILLIAAIKRIFVASRIACREDRLLHRHIPSWCALK
jgi:hypothetical protein